MLFRPFGRRGGETLLVELGEGAGGVRDTEWRGFGGRAGLLECEVRDENGFWEVGDLTSPLLVKVGKGRMSHFEGKLECEGSEILPVELLGLIAVTGTAVLIVVDWLVG